MTTEPNDRWRHALVIFLVSMAGLLLEVAYTRIISYKLWYYYSYLVIGLALLGIGTGAIALATVKRLREAETGTLLRVSCTAAAILVPIGYLIIARLPINTVEIWNYGTKGSFKNLAALGLISFLLFASFISVGIVVSAILGRAKGPVGGLYFGDLVGAALACILAIPLISAWGPPALVVVTALIFGVAAIVSEPFRVSVGTIVTSAVTLVLVAVVIGHNSLPDVRPELNKLSPQHAAFKKWGPVFRVDVHELTKQNYLLAHDASFGSGIWAYNGDPTTLKRFDIDPRRLAFDLLGTPPQHTLIVGSAGGNEILAALHFGSKKIEGVELNPVTVSILKKYYADYTGHLDRQPGVTIHQADATSFVARSNDHYNMVWFVAPDSYAANNAVSSGAFVLSESYLYTAEMIKRSLEHLTDDGVMVTQFGELNFATRPNRTARYVVTARDALKSLGVEHPEQHIVVVDETGTQGSAPTVMLKRTPFTTDEIARLQKSVPTKPVVVPVAGKTVIENWRILYAPTLPPADHIVARLAAAPTEAEMRSVEATYPLSITAVHDDKPFFWHFASTRSVLGHILSPIHEFGFDPENSIGERVLLLLLAISIIYAAIFLLLPLVLVRRTFSVLPARAASTVYFGGIGLGFIMFEITMIQRLTRLLGFPTYSLTITLAAILLSTGIGALLSRRFESRSAAAMPALFGVLCVLTIAYEFGLDHLTDQALSWSLGARIATAVVILTPLGLVLGMFMPFGLAQVHRIAPGPTYATWAWAINGFLSVIGSVLTTILAMEYGFKTVQWLALVIYVFAVVAFLRLGRVPVVEIAPDAYESEFATQGA